jgi:hypothetical protein
MLNFPRGNMKTTCSKCDMALEPHRLGKQRYCNTCHAGNMRLKRPKHSELNEEAMVKANARGLAHYYRDKGEIAKKACELCNSPNSEMHHEDYSKPKEVVWLCRPCHLDEHMLVKSKK